MAIRVQSIGVGQGTSADLTDAVVGLQWSSVNPGGDELCSFQVKRQWFSGAPETAQGNLLWITDGLTRLWSGRIEENDRAVSDSEYIGITAYGLGNLLKDTRMTEVYVDRDPGAWGPMPYNDIATNWTAQDTQTLAWQTEAGGLICPAPNQAITSAIAETWYTAPTGATIAKVQFVGTDTSLPAGWQAPNVRFAADDANTVGEGNAVTFDSTLRALTNATPRRYVFWTHRSSGVAATPAAGSNRRISAIGVYGNHGLTTRAINASTPDGLYVEDIVADAVGRASGITVARKDATGIILPHFVPDPSTAIEDVVTQANQYAGFDWGTFGASSALDTSTNGYFSFSARDTATAHWYVRRSDCDDVSLQVELASLYSSVDVVYSDPTTTGTQIVTRTTTAQVLADAGISRKATLQGGTLTLAGAQQLGDIFLALTSGYAPARGSIRLTVAPTHYQRGVLPPWFMRADGSNIRVPDVLPSKDALSLAAAPDRRTTFPIKRVSVDASGQTPVVSVEVDQTSDQLSALQARLGLAAQYPTAALPPGVSL